MDGLRRQSLCFLLVTALLLGCSLAPSTTPTPLKSVTFVSPTPSAINVLNLCAAIGEGYMAEEGINATFEALDGPAAFGAVVAGQAAIGISGPGPLFSAKARGESPVMIYNHFPQAIFGLVVEDDSAVQTPADLAGMVIGVGALDSAEVAFAGSIMSDAGLGEGDFDFLAVGDGGLATAAFERGDIGAYAGSVFDQATMNHRGISLREITPEKFLSRFGAGIYTLQSTIDSDREMIAGFVRALLRGQEFAAANKDRTLEHCATLNPEEGSDREFASALFDAILARMQPLGGLPVGVYSDEPWQAWHDSLVAAGELEEPLAGLNEMWTNEFAEAAHQD